MIFIFAGCDEYPDESGNRSRTRPQENLDEDNSDNTAGATPPLLTGNTDEPPARPGGGPPDDIVVDYHDDPGISGDPQDDLPYNSPEEPPTNPPADRPTNPPNSHSPDPQTEPPTDSSIILPADPPPASPPTDPQLPVNPPTDLPPPTNPPTNPPPTNPPTNPPPTSPPTNPPPTSPPTDPPDASGGYKKGYLSFKFTATDLYGNSVTEKSFGEKQLFFIHYWATWCGPCIHEMPDLAKLAKDFGDSVGFIGLLDDFSTNPGGAKRIMEASGVPSNFIMLNADSRELSSLMKTVQSGYLPTTAIVDINGNMVYDQLIGAYQDWYAVILDHLLTTGPD